MLNEEALDRLSEKLAFEEAMELSQGLQWNNGCRLYSSILPQEFFKVQPDDGREKGRNFLYTLEFNYKQEEVANDKLQIICLCEFTTGCTNLYLVWFQVSTMHHCYQSHLLTN
jgi:hypothetical protein